MYAARRIVHFESAQIAAPAATAFCTRSMAASRAPRHDAEDLAHLVAGLVAAEAGPGDVVVDRAGLVELGPHIEQHEVAAADRARSFVSVGS